MKKNISINLQGIIFYIEEDGYEVLSRYLAEVKAHFSNYRGHEEIVADIEGRIAELFAARLSPTKQVITWEDVQAMTAKMGRVSDFQSADEAEDDDELLADAVANGTAAGTYTAGPKTSYTRTASATETSTDTDEPRRLSRDMANRKIAGVAAGIARYFSVNPLWIRLGFLALFILLPILLDDVLWLDDLAGKLAAVSLISYVILWIALPKRYDIPPEQEDQSYKKLYRDTDNGKVGGVSAGLAAYLNTDVTLVRVLFILGLFVGGISFILYPLLWILLPEAKTISDKMRMRGDAVTLSGIDNNVRNNAFDANSPGNNRRVGAFLEEVAAALNPLLSFVGTALRIFAGVLLSVIGFSLLLGFVVTLGMVLGLIPESQNPTFGSASFLKILNEQPTWAWLSGFVVAAIPSLGLLLVGIGLLLRRTLVSRTVGWSLFGLWLLSIIGVTTAVARQSREFQYEADVEQTQQFPALTKPVLRLETRNVDREGDQWVDVQLAAADSGRAVEVLRRLSAKGASEAEASRTAAASIAYTVRTRGDSTLVFDDHFSFQPNARYRDQDLEVTIRLPRDRSFHISRDFAYWIGDDNFVGNRRPNDAENFTYRLRGNKLECINCPADERSTDEDNADYEDGANDNDEDDDNANINLDFGSVGKFATNENAYGPDRQRFDEADFDHVSIVGPYYVVLRQGGNYEVKAAGNGRALRDIKIERNGEELTIRPRNREIFDSRRGGNERVLITITTPELNELELVGGSRAEVSGFNSGNLRVEQAGGSQLRFTGSLDELQLELAGGCRTALKGSANSLNIDGAAGCEVAAAGFTARRADVDLVGGSKVRLHVTDELDADAVAASVIEYSGSPATVRRDATGASRVSSVDDVEE